MRALTASEQMEVWDLGLRRPMAWRALYLLAASTGIPLNELSQLPLGRRDTMLLKLREVMFGPRIAAVSTCPECREEMEWEFGVDELITDDAAATAAAAPNGQGVGPVASSHLLEVDGYAVRFRLPNSQDLEVIAACESGGDARDLILARCVSEIKFANSANGGGNDADSDRDGNVANEIPTSVGTLPAGVVKAVVEKMTELDTQANVQLNLTCPSCGHNWPTVFDIASFLWTEIDDLAKRTMRDIHLLASAYGWSEDQIVGLSPGRRRWYVEVLENA
jgi:hypothetical protein